LEKKEATKDDKLLILFRYGSSLAIAGRHKEARKTFLEGLKLSPFHLSFYHALREETRLLSRQESRDAASCTVRHDTAALDALRPMTIAYHLIANATTSIPEALQYRGFRVPRGADGRWRPTTFQHLPSGDEFDQYVTKREPILVSLGQNMYMRVSVMVSLACLFCSSCLFISL